MIAAACTAGGPDADPPGGREPTDDPGDHAPAPDREVVECRVEELVDTPEGMPVDQVAVSAPEDVTRAVDDPYDPRLPDPLLDPDDLLPLAGPDAIISLDDPRFVPATDIRFLAGCEEVLVLDIDGDVRGYPVQIMVWHEIVNDTVGGVPVAVTFCPLCNSAVAVGRAVDGRVLEFGTSGWVHNSALVMYDRQTGSLWDHFIAKGVIGELVGTELDRFAVSTVSFEQLLAEHPDALVLTRDTGVRRSYGLNPYQFYDQPGTAFGFDGTAPEGYEEKERFLGVEGGDDAVAIRLDHLFDLGVLSFTVDGIDMVAWALPGTAGTTDLQLSNQGTDVGSTGVFLPVVDGLALTFDRDETGFVDRETGSHWSVLGRSDAGPLAGSRLEAVAHLDTFWFAWTAFHPDTRVIDA
ncbi:MAG: DUF3179 domain-containing protein [Acidimicrobiales bacterium]